MMQITWSRQFGPYEPATAIKVIKLLRRNGCRNVRPVPGGFVEAKLPMTEFDNLSQKLKQFPTSRR